MCPGAGALAALRSNITVSHEAERTIRSDKAGEVEAAPLFWVEALAGQAQRAHFLQ
jgi:hypothetical protein